MDTSVLISFSFAFMSLFIPDNFFFVLVQNSAIHYHVNLSTFRVDSLNRTVHFHAISPAGRERTREENRFERLTCPVNSSRQLQDQLWQREDKHVLVHSGDRRPFEVYLGVKRNRWELSALWHLYRQVTLINIPQNLMAIETRASILVVHDYSSNWNC